MKTSLAGFILLVSVVLLGGCGTLQTAWQENFKVAPGLVTEVKKQPAAKVDVYVPLREQYASSKHAQALETLNNYSGRQDYCYNCHSAEYRLAPEGSKPSPKQLGTSITCIVCHDLTKQDFRLKTTPLETCTNCHNAVVEITPGAAVHHPQKEMFSGKGALEVADKPSTKFNAGLTCIECHMPNQSHTYKALTPSEAIDKKVGSTCMMCHTKLSPKEFAQKVDELQNQVEQNIVSLKKDLEAVKSELDKGKSAGRNLDEAQRMYDIAFTNVSFVEADKSKGVHNFEYASAILNVAKEKISNAQQLLRK